MEKSRVIELACKIDGWMDTNEMEWLYDQAAAVPAGGVWVEVGCWKGRSFLPTAMGINGDATLWAVDTFEGDARCPAHWDGREVPNWVYDHFRITIDAIRRLRGVAAPVMKILRCSSMQASFGFQTKSVNGVFIDASHFYDSVSADIKAWMPLIKPGGIISGHDFSYPDVERAVKELVPNWEQGPKTIWWARQRHKKRSGTFSTSDHRAAHSTGIRSMRVN